MNGSGDGAAAPKILTADKILQLASVEIPSYIYPGFLVQNGLLLLIGTLKTFKSILTLKAALTMAKGNEGLWGITQAKKDHRGQEDVFTAREPIRVLMFDQEVGLDGMKFRLNKMLGGESPSYLTNIGIVTRESWMRFDTPEGQRTIKALCLEFAPHVVIFDPLHEFHLCDENDRTAMTRIFKYLREEVIGAIHKAHGHKPAIWMCHHTPHVNPDNPLASLRARGSTVLGGAADMIVALSGPQYVERGVYELEVFTTPRHTARISPFKLTVSEADFSISFGGWSKGRKQTAVMGAEGVSGGMAKGVNTNGK